MNLDLEVIMLMKKAMQARVFWESAKTEQQAYEWERRTLAFIDAAILINDAQVGAS